ncbi:MAG TPA: hypothetical protein EYG38_01480, partial [Verrucomicrobia bacterium]|nr:hypothetical protein [Verrucomicrobiota bacterium]
MKKLHRFILYSLLVCLPALGWSQGQVNFTNFAPPGVDAQVTSSDGSHPEGDSTTATLWVGTTEGDLSQVGEASGFLTGAGAGYFVGGTVTIDGIGGGSAAFAQVRYAGAESGETDIVSVTLGGPGTPPTPPANLTGLSSVTTSGGGGGGEPTPDPDPEPGPAVDNPGQVNFTNFAPPGVDAQVSGVGDGYTAVLFAGPTGGALAQHGDASGFLTGAGAGYFVGGVITITTVTSGSDADVEVRVLDANGGLAGSFNTITVTTGGPGTPPTPPANLAGLEAFEVSGGGGEPPVSFDEE